MQGLYIQVKAYAAKCLLKLAWQRTLETRQKSKPWPWATSWPVARLRVPAKNVDMIVLSSDWRENMDFGSYRRTSACVVDERGSVVISAQQDGFAHKLNALGAGDVLNIQMADGGEHIFSVADTQVVDEEASIILDAKNPMLTLVTPYPCDDHTHASHLRFLLFAVRKPHIIL